MQNLVNNAVKFTMEGEIKIGYTVQDNKTVRCFVKDTGIGIDSKDFMIIFDQFRQIDSSDVRKFRGTGLGLAICRNLATLLSGKIWVDSVPGEGSAFYVELPIFSGLLLDSDENVKSEKSTDTGQVTMLMVDDDPDSLMLMSTMMQNESVQVITTDSGYKALEILDREALPDVVLMDLEMPVMNGAQTLTIIREKYPELKVVAQSAHALEGDREKTIVSGFDDYISKPFNKQSILEVIKSSNRTQVDINTC
jgi:CheY-like chemotaxis protein